MTERDEAGSARCLVLHPHGPGARRRLRAGGRSRGARRSGRGDAGRGRSGAGRGRLRGLARAEGGRAGDPCARGEPRRAGAVPAGGGARGRGPRLANPSALVFRATGCHGVAEGAALAAVGPAGELLVAKTRSARATLAIARAPGPIDVARIGRPRGGSRWSASARAPAAWRTAEVEAMLADAEDVVGYRLYLDLLGPGRAASRRRHGFALGEEEARCPGGLDLAGEGRRVALVCSGDAGIYAMAALVFELLERRRPAWQRVGVDDQPGHLGAAGGGGACRRAARPRFLRGLAVRPADALGGDRAPARGGGRRRLRDRLLQSGLAAAAATSSDARLRHPRHAPAAGNTGRSVARNLGRAGEAVDGHDAGGTATVRRSTC